MSKVFLNKSEKDDINEIFADLTKKHPFNDHPRIITDSYGFERIRSLRQKGTSTIKGMINNFISEADNVSLLPLTLKSDRFYEGMLFSAREVMRRMIILCGAYRLTLDKKYADKAWKEAQNVLDNYGDWCKSGKLLDQNEMTTAFAIAFDWLYDYLSENQKMLMCAAIYKTISYAEKVYSDANGRWNTKAANVVVICNSGVMLGALAVADEALWTHEEKNTIIYCARESFHSMLGYVNCYAPDGVWREGLRYWQAATKSFVKFVTSVISACGKDYGLLTLEGFDKTGFFAAFMSGPAGSFCFGDTDRKETLMNSNLSLLVIFSVMT